MDEKIPSKRFGEKLRTLREQRGLSQRELGILLGVDASHLGRIERSEKNPNLAMLLKLIDVFDVSLDTLVRDDRELDV